jgi:hypothetical protein
VSSAKHSGLELVRRQPRKAKLATNSDCAKLDFKPWKRERRFEQVLSGKQAQSLSARVAYATMLQSRKKLIGVRSTMTMSTR